MEIDPNEVVASGNEETTEPTPEPDYKAELAAKEQELEQERQANAKLELSLKSAQGALKRPLDTETELKRTRKEVSRLAELVRLSLEAQAQGDTEELAKVVTTTQARYQAEDAKDAATEEIRELWHDIGEEIAD